MAQQPDRPEYHVSEYVANKFDKSTLAARSLVQKRVGSTTDAKGPGGFNIYYS